MKYYLASGFFTKETRTNVAKMAEFLREQGHEVFVPMEHDFPNAFEMTNEEWSRKVFDMDVEAIKNCDRVILLDYGMNSDSGASWECGYAYAIGKPVDVMPYGDKCSLMVACSARKLLKSVELQ